MGTIHQVLVGDQTDEFIDLNDPVTRLCIAWELKYREKASDHTMLYASSLIPRNSVLQSNVAIKRKRNPETDTFRRLIDLICRGEFLNFDQSLEKFYGRTFIWRKGNFKIYD